MSDARHSTTNRTLVVIPAKGTSTRVPGKNLRPLGGVPLFLWTVRAALAVRPAVTVVVSTDEGPNGDEIARLAEAEGASVIRRPPELCRDPAQLADVVHHALGAYMEHHPVPDAFVALLPTSPFREARHIEEALALHYGTDGCQNVVSVDDGRWLREKLHFEVGGALRTVLADAYWLREGEVPCVAHSAMARILNGAIWVSTLANFHRDHMISPNGALPYVMDAEAGLDIDTETDFLVAGAILAQRSQAGTTRGRSAVGFGEMVRA